MGRLLTVGLLMILPTSLPLIKFSQRWVDSISKNLIHL